MPFGFHSLTGKKQDAPRRAFLLGAALPCVILTLIYWQLEVWPLGTKTLLEADAVHQYLPFLTELRRHLVNGESLFYSFSGGLGYNFWSTIAYYAASPFNLITALLPEYAVCDFMTWARPRWEPPTPCATIS